jgi:hypothetical protein
VLLHWLLQKPCQTPNKKTASKLKPWRSHFAICTTDVKPKIVASRGLLPTCEIEATTTTILPDTLQNSFSFTKEAILGPFWQGFPSASPLASTEALPNP